ncbi:MAG: hypothetical protein IKN57_02230, partial [Parasporobacterium sp.]|nr:hypothetical protein [Parasporobacterium sp.]
TILHIPARLPHTIPNIVLFPQIPGHDESAANILLCKGPTSARIPTPFPVNHFIAANQSRHCTFADPQPGEHSIFRVS